MVYTKLEITLHSAKALTDVKVFGTMDPYAVLWVAGAGDSKQSTRYTTKVAKKTSSFPVWDCCLEFNVASMHNNYTLFCEIMHAGKLFDRKIGEVQVRSQDLLAGDATGEKVSYPVKISSGEVKGEIILSHRFLEPVVRSGEKDDSGKKTEKVTGAPGEKVQRKKKGRMVKQIATNVVTKVASEAVLLAGTVGVLFAVGSFGNENESTAEAAAEAEPEAEPEAEVEEEVEVEDEYEDEDEF